MTWHPDTPQEYRNQVVTGDARLLAERIPDESVDLIFTDPVYERIEDYEWLAAAAVRVLKPDSALLAFAGVGTLPETHDALRRHVTYRWRVVFRILFGAGGGSWRGRIQAGTQELLIYEKGKARLFASLFDFMTIVRQQHGTRMRRDGKRVWGKPLDAVVYPLRAFAKPGAVIFDPFTGGGTVPAACKLRGCNYIAFEIDPDTAAAARERVANTQPPLFVPEPEQMGMEMTA